jgi:hypothetical protein
MDWGRGVVEMYMTDWGRGNRLLEVEPHYQIPNPKVSPTKIKR